MRVPDPLPVYTTKYDNFKGVDFTSQIPDRQHFPVGKNFVIDEQGCHKRFGYKLEQRISYEENGERVCPKINGIYKYELSGETQYLIHAGTKLYTSNSDLSDVEELTGFAVADNASKAICASECFILATGEEWFVHKMRKLTSNTAIKEYTVDGSNAKYSFEIPDYSEAYTYHFYAGNIELQSYTDYIRIRNVVTLLNTERSSASKGNNIEVKRSGSDITESVSIPEYFYVSVAVSDVAAGGYAYKTGSDILPFKDGALLRDCFYSGEDNEQYRLMINIPDIHNGEKIYVPYITSAKISDADLDNTNRKFSDMLIINDRYARDITPQIMIELYSILPMPAIRNGLKMFYSNTAGSNTWTYDKILTEYGGERTNDEYNLISPYVSYRGDNFQHSLKNSGSGYIDGYVISEKEGFGSQTAYFVFEDGSVYNAYVQRRKVGSIDNVALDDKNSLYLTFVRDREGAGYPTIVPPEKTGKPFEILVISETSYRLFAESQIWKCKEFATLQYGNGIYYFMTGNSEMPNRDWHSVINDPLNIPSTAYTIYGVNEQILGYGQYGKYLAVFKKGESDSNIYIRTANYVDGLGVTFPVEVGVGGAIKGLSAASIANLAGETMYLTEDGIYALTALNTSDFSIMRKRSFYIDGRLRKEASPENADACIWKGRYILGINGNVYLLDGTQPKDYLEGTNNEYAYQSLFWDNIPARVFFVDGDKLYFGDNAGNIWRFADENTDAAYRYRDGYIDAENKGQPVNMVISTKLDDDGDFMSLKKVLKKGSGMLVKPYRRSTYSVGYIYDNLEELTVRENAHADIFDFNDIDFEDFSFVASGDYVILPFLKKSKKYKALQIVVKSENNEPFSILGIIKRYTINNYVKR